MNYCSICNEPYPHYSRFVSNPEGIREVKIITSHAGCRNREKKENERRIYEKEIQLKILNLEYEIFVLKENLISLD